MKFDLFADHVAPLEEVAGANEVCFLIVLLMFPMFTPFQGRENFDFSSLKTAFGSLPRRKHKKDNIFSPIFQGDGGGAGWLSPQETKFFLQNNVTGALCDLCFCFDCSGELCGFAGRFTRDRSLEDCPSMTTLKGRPTVGPGTEQSQKMIRLKTHFCCFG